MSGDELFGSLKQMENEGVKYGRRRFIVALGVAAAGIAGWQYYATRPQTYYKRAVSFITPNEEFYNVSVNMFYQPEVDLEKWRLDLIGLDGKKSALSLADIKSMPNRVITRTLSCVSNNVGWPDISNAEWRVVSLREVLAP